MGLAAASRPTGRALAGMLAVFAEFEREILSERVKAGIAQARSKGKALGRPVSVANKAAEVRSLYRKKQTDKIRDRPEFWELAVPPSVVFF